MTTKPKQLNRPTSTRVDRILGEAFPVLDHGFVRVVDYMGDDAAIVQAARVSYGEGTNTPSDDRSLIRYLLRHYHTTPFEMCEIKLHIKCPIFVARQWIRHRTANVNEYSGRYSIMPAEFYVPEMHDIQGQSTSNKQGREAGGVTAAGQALAKGIFEGTGESMFAVYDRLGEMNVSRELARIVLPLSTYTEFYWKIDLHNLLHFLRLRIDPHAQKEIREFARMIAEIVSGWVPVAYEAFVDYRLGAASFSRMEMNFLRMVLEAYEIDEAALKESLVPLDFGLSKREQAELLAKLKSE
jgi:thymidylate synthase (FAD)